MTEKRAFCHKTLKNIFYLIDIYIITEAIKNEVFEDNLLMYSDYIFIQID